MKEFTTDADLLYEVSEKLEVHSMQAGTDYLRVT